MSTLRRLAAGGIVLALALPLAGCGGSQSALAPAGPQAKRIDDLWLVLLTGSIVVFAVVLVVLGAALLRRRGTPADAPDRRVSGRTLLAVAVAGAGIPLVVLVGLFALTVASLPGTSSASASHADTTLTIRVTGRQWFWDVAYPDEGVRTANEIHVPVGEPVRVEVTSADVIHSLWVPRLTRKIDMIPGHVNVLRLEADREGSFRGQCAEYCGLQHGGMAFWVVAEPRDEFDAWLASERAAGAVPQTVAQKQGQLAFLGSACVYCHRIAGTNASGMVGPDLTHVASRLSLAAGVLPNTRGWLAGWILDPQHLKPGNRMPGTSLSGPELQDLLDYLESLR